MNLYLVRPVTGNLEKGPWMPWYDKQFGILCRAENEAEARPMAASDAGDEGKAAWLNPALTECIDVRDLYQGGPEVLMRDFASA